MPHYSDSVSQDSDSIRHDSVSFASNSETGF